MVILDPNLEERTIEPSLDKYLNVIRKDGGSVENVDVWGRRRLAHEPDHRLDVATAQHLRGDVVAVPQVARPVHDPARSATELLEQQVAPGHGPGAAAGAEHHGRGR